MKDRLLDSSSVLPLVVEPERDTAEGRGLPALLEWIASERDWIETKLLYHGGILLRGFAVRDIEDFERFSLAISPQLGEYIRGNSPRSKISGKVYTSTEFPCFFPLPLHNELSYVPRPPSKVMFFCVTPPAIGGRTPIADMRKVYQRIRPEVRQRFIEKQVRYIQNVPARGSVPWLKTWPSMFETGDKLRVEEACRQRSLDFRWDANNTLHLTNVRPSVMAHPKTGEQVWFNQAHIFHNSWSSEFWRHYQVPIAIGAKIRELYHATRFQPEEYPTHCVHGDGSMILPEDLRHIRDVLWDTSTSFPWQQGDVLLLDNISVSHARSPFLGKRRIVVTLSYD